MTKKSAAKAQSTICRCGGERRVEGITEIYERDGIQVRVAGIPALVCDTCGDPWLEPGTAQAIVEAVNGLFALARVADLYQPYVEVALSGRSAVAADLGRRGGRVSSEAKRQAARENGRKGGRPRKKPAA